MRVFAPNSARANVFSVLFKSAMLTSRATYSPSIWWNWSMWLASICSARYTRPGNTSRSGGLRSSIARTQPGEVCVRSRRSRVAERVSAPGGAPASAGGATKYVSCASRAG